MYKKIYNVIKKYNNIVIARHIGADIDALGSQIALKDIIKTTFPKKNVYAVGAYAAKFKTVGILDKEVEEMYENSLLIIVDCPTLKRTDASNIENFSYVVKIDHHPFEEKFSDIELVDEEASSASELIVDLCKNTKLILTKYAAERLYMGIVSDTGRFLHPTASPKTFSVCAELLKKYDIDKTALYKTIYIRNLAEVSFNGYVYQNLKVTENGVGYILITDEIQKQFGVDPATSGNVVNELTYINELLAWVTFSEDKKQEYIRGSIRSRGPIINTLAMQYNGGGHKLASGLRIKDFSEADEIIEALDKICKEYKEENE